MLDWKDYFGHAWPLAHRYPADLHVQAVLVLFCLSIELPPKTPLLLLAYSVNCNLTGGQVWSASWIPAIKVLLLAEHLIVGMEALLPASLGSFIVSESFCAVMSPGIFESSFVFPMTATHLKKIHEWV